MFSFAAVAAALLLADLGVSSSVHAATMTEPEPRFIVPGTVHEDRGRPLQARSRAGMPATVANFLAGKGRGAAAINSLQLRRQGVVGRAGKRVLDYEQEVQGLKVYGVRVKAIFDRNGDLVKVQENLVRPGPITRAAITHRVALDVALARVHPDLSPSLTESGRSGNSVSFAGDSFFYRAPRVSKVALPLGNDTMSEGFLVETWSGAGNQLHHVLISGDGQLLNVQNRTANDSYNIFKLNPDKSAQTIEVGPAPGGTLSPDGWLDSGSQNSINITGNNVRAYLDADDTNSPDAGGNTITDDNFVTAHDRLADPTTLGNQEVAVQNLFYLNNIIHDELFAYGFTEDWRNFQDFNFGPDGFDGDAVQAEAQDGAGTNNANFATPPDGSEPRMQMFLWDGVIVDPLLGTFFLNYAYAANLVIGEFDGDPTVTEHVLAADALFGPALTDVGVASDIVYIGGNGCAGGMNGVDVTGKVALMDRGCPFVTKAQNAQAAGAVAVIVSNNESNGDDLIQMAGDDTGNPVIIPSVLVGYTDGLKLKALATPPAGVAATLRSNPADSRDGDLDADIVRHEYGHGLTWRLIGNMDGIMGGSLGEGMSDAYAAIMTNDDRIGEYSYALPIGIRGAPYSNWKSDTGRVYESFVGAVHDDGEIYAAIIWDMWRRYRDDLSGGVTGTLEQRQNEIMTDLVSGMKVTLHQCEQPTFQTMRNGVLEAIGGTSDPNGAVDPSVQDKWCHAWRAFAKHGVGANQSTNCSIDFPIPQLPSLFTVTWTWVNGFDVPAQCNNLGGVPSAAISSPSNGHNVPVGQNISFAGSANDSEDGDLSDDIFWMSSIDGEFGRGNSVSTSGLSDGAHTITASVTDGDGNSASDTIAVTVTATNPGNKAPIANFTFVTSGLSVNFTDTSTDSDGTIVSWDWDFGDGNSSSDENPTHLFASAGIYAVRLTVVDDDGADTTTGHTVIVSESTSNTAPVVDAGADDTINEGETFTSSGSFTDPDADSWTGTVNYGDGSGDQALTLNGDKTFNLSHTYTVDGVFTVTVTVNDGTADGSDTAEVTVNATGNTTPVVDAGADDTIGEGGTFNSSGSFTDPDADSWTGTVNYGDGSGNQALVLNGDKTFSLNHTYTVDGIFTVTVTVNDGTADGSDTAEVTVNNVTPVVDAGADDTINEGETFTSSGSFSDPGADNWTGTVNYGDGNGNQVLTLNGDKTFNLSHTYASDGIFTVTVTVNDGTADGSDTAEVTVNAIGGNQPPTAVAASNQPQPVTAGKGKNAEGEVTLFGSGSSDDNGIISYSWSWSGGTLSNQADDTVTLPKGTHTITLTVDDGEFQDTDTVCVEIYNKNPGFTCGSVGDASPTVTIDNPSDGTTVSDGETINLSGTASDTEDGNISANLSWSSDLDGGLGSGSSLSNVALTVGTHVITASVTDSGGNPGSDTITVTVQAAGAINLSAIGYKVKGKHTIDLTWSGNGDNVDVYRDGGLVASNVGGNVYTDATGNKGGGVTYSYEVCETGGTSDCSNTASASF